MADYLHGSVLLYLDKLIDWGDYFARTKGDGVDASAERQALRSLLETCAEICAKIEPEARATIWITTLATKVGSAKPPKRSFTPTLTRPASRSRS